MSGGKVSETVRVAEIRIALDGYGISVEATKLSELRRRVAALDPSIEIPSHIRRLIDESLPPLKSSPAVTMQSMTEQGFMRDGDIGRQVRKIAEGIGLNVGMMKPRDILRTLESLSESMQGITPILKSFRAELERRAAEMGRRGRKSSIPPGRKRFDGIYGVDPEISKSVLGFVSDVKSLRWGEGYGQEEIDRHSDPIRMGYGYALLKEGMQLSLGMLAPGDAVFGFRDRVTGIVVIGRLPTIVDTDLVRRNMLEQFRIDRDSSRRRTSISPLQELRLGLRDGLTPYDYEMASAVLELGRLRIPAKRLIGGAVFLTGKPLPDSYGIPPAPVVKVLGAMKLAGFGISMIEMLPSGFLAGKPVTYGSNWDLAPTVGGIGFEIPIDLASSVVPVSLEAEKVAMTLTGNYPKDSLLRQIVPQYHLPLAAGLWANDSGEFRRRVYDFLDVADGLEGEGLERFVLGTYQEWNGLVEIEGEKGGGGEDGGFGGATDGSEFGSISSMFSINPPGNLVSACAVQGAYVMNAGI